MEIRVTVCDECREVGRPVDTWRIIHKGRSVSVKLCEEDSRPLARWFKAPQRKTQFNRRVTTVEEIEASKASRPPADPKE